MTWPKSNRIDALIIMSPHSVFIPSSSSSTNSHQYFWPHLKIHSQINCISNFLLPNAFICVNSKYETEQLRNFGCLFAIWQRNRFLSSYKFLIQCIGFGMREDSLVNKIRHLRRYNPYNNQFNTVFSSSFFFVILLSNWMPSKLNFVQTQNKNYKSTEVFL